MGKEQKKSPQLAVEMAKNPLQKLGEGGAVAPRISEKG